MVFGSLGPLGEWRVESGEWESGESLGPQVLGYLGTLVVKGRICQDKALHMQAAAEVGVHANNCHYVQREVEVSCVFRKWRL